MYKNTHIIKSVQIIKQSNKSQNLYIVVESFPVWHLLDSINLFLSRTNQIQLRKTEHYFFANSEHGFAAASQNT